MKKIIYGAMAAAALLACSKEQVIEQNRANDEIGFSVVAENQTKAADVYTSTNMMEAFTVSATYTKDGSTSWYFQNDNIQYEKNSGWVNTNNVTRYWSADGTHNFYAIVNGRMDMAEATAAPTVNFKPETTVASQKDLLYAVATNLDKEYQDVDLTFRHALAQIEFKAKNTNPKLYVKISEVTVAQTPGEGTFTYPTETTYYDVAKGTWEIDMNTPTDYNVKFPNHIIVEGDSEPVNLTFSDTPTKNNNSMLLLPAKTTAIYIDNTIEEGKIPELRSTTEEEAGTYLAVKCQIYNVAGTAYADTDVCLHDGWAIIPAEFDWKQGKKYIYTFVFGKGNFGYDGGNGDTPIPGEDDVLSYMDYEVKVDDFKDGEEIDKW